VRIVNNKTVSDSVFYYAASSSTAFGKLDFEEQK
jgi:hypothetical protein